MLINFVHVQKTVRVKLSANFASFEQPDEFAVKSSDGAVIAVLLGDGVQIDGVAGKWK